MKGTSGVVPLDGLLIRGNQIIALEIKSPREITPKADYSGSALKNDYIKEHRGRIRKDINKGRISQKVGDIQVHVAQAEERTKHLIEGKWYPRELNHPLDLRGKEVLTGLAVPLDFAQDTLQALKQLGISNPKTIQGQHSSTIIWKKR